MPLVLVAWLCGWTNAQASLTVRILLAETSGIYREAADSLARALEGRGVRVVTSSPQHGESVDVGLTVAIGTQSLERALVETGRPVLALLVPRQSFERLATGQRQVTALYLDQPVTRQLHLLHLALPGLKAAGVPLGPVSREVLPELQAATKMAGVQVEVAVVERSTDLHAALTTLAENSQAFILLPDPVVVQRSTLQSLLLQTYRLRKPVLAYSAPLVQSGALLALYATPAQFGEEAADWIREGWNGSEYRLGLPRHPGRFTLRINRTVARALDVELPSEASLIRQLEALR